MFAIFVFAQAILRQPSKPSICLEPGSVELEEVHPCCVRFSHLLLFCLSFLVLPFGEPRSIEIHASIDLCPFVLDGVRGPFGAGLPCYCSETTKVQERGLVKGYFAP